MKFSDRVLYIGAAYCAALFALMSLATWGAQRAGWITDPSAPPSCATYWAAHPDDDHATYNRQHHIRAKCAP